jgi:hypothetical protein
MAAKSNKYTTNNNKSILELLQQRFTSNLHRHKCTTWEQVKQVLINNSKLLQVVKNMEETGGEPDVVDLFNADDMITFCDCSTESPVGRRSLCYDKKAWNERKEFKPENNVLDVAAKIGITLLDEINYVKLQSFGAVDCKTSSWIQTPEAIRNLGGALFGDYRYGRVFIYHNGASSYYGSRGFRGYISAKIC